MSCRLCVKAVLTSVAILLFGSSNPAAGQVRVLIDASVDGGLWWGPQTSNYDPNLPHQGKPLADYLRSQGMTVTELTPGNMPTCDHLSSAELVIVLDGIVRRLPTVISQYVGYVSNGGRLILLNEAHTTFSQDSDDSVSLALGLDFNSSVAGTITSFAAHPITAGVTSLNYLTGSIVTRAPTGATMLGFLSGQPVMGVMPFGYGRVFFIGETNAIEGVQGVLQPLISNLLAFMLNGAAAVKACSVDVGVDFGPTYGVWRVDSSTAWSPVHTLTPEEMVRGDLDGNGFDDLVFDFGAGFGVYAWMNHTTWSFIHPLSPTQMVTGDFDDNGRTDIVGVFQGYGIWRWHDGIWTQVHPLDNVRLAVGSIDSYVGRDDLVADFTGYGIYMLANGTTWSALHPLNAAALLTADIDLNGQDEVVVSFTGYGLYAYRNNTTWVQLNTASPVRMAAGRIDAHPAEDLVLDFGPSFGLWTLRNNATWLPLHPLSAETLALADRDGTGRDEILVDFGPTYGLWQFANDTTWSQLHALSPEALVPGRFH
jgi:hypothetical protein